jgi:hypothetical protein
MRYDITWTAITTHHTHLDLTTEQLAAWAITAIPGILFAQTSDALAGSTEAQLADLINRNTRLWDRLLVQYLEQASPAAPSTQLAVVDITTHPVDGTTHGEQEPLV